MTIGVKANTNTTSMVKMEKLSWCGMLTSLQKNKQFSNTKNRTQQLPTKECSGAGQRFPSWPARTKRAAKPQNKTAFQTTDETRLQRQREYPQWPETQSGGRQARP